MERIEPRSVVIGRGSLLYLEGWCFHPERRIRRLEVVVGDRFHAVTAFPFARPEIALELGEPWARGGGFCAIVPFDQGWEPGQHEILLRARLAGGDVCLERCGSVEVLPRRPANELALSRPAGTEPLIAICMATYNPDRRLFERQVETIRAQTHERFVCLVSDDGSEPGAWSWIERIATADPRFACFRNPSRLGFYRNFERCLGLVPADAAYVALADQDDVWHPDKLATLLDALRESGALLAYSDMNIVSAGGRRIASTYWADRSNNSTRLGSLLIANSVTGAASLFRRELLDDVLPLPPDVGHSHHDHWIACVALALGELAYVDRPLYDYVQHDANVVGHYTGGERSGLLHMIVRFATNPRLRLRNTITFGRTLYLTEVLRLELIGRTLELRLSGRMASAHAADVRRVARLSSSFRSLAWLLARSACDVRGHGETLGIENQLAKGILWRHGQVLRARIGRGGA